MTSLRRVNLGAVGLVATASMVTACSSGGGQNSDASSETAPVVKDGTFTIAVGSDVGNLDPQSSDTGASHTVAQFLYDLPVYLDAQQKVQPGVVSSWQQDGPTTWTLTVRKDVTCSDGSAMDAATVARNISYVADKKNASPYGGLTVPLGAKATADPANSTVTVDTGAADPFFLENIAYLPLVCGKGIDDRGMLKKGAAGSGPYVLTENVAGTQITLTRRDDYRWGPTGNTSASTAGIPKKVIIKTIGDQTSSANQLVAGQLNAAAVQGPDQTRLKSAGLFVAGIGLPGNSLYFNQLDKGPAQNAAVRKALVQALDPQQLAKLDSSGFGTTATGLFADPKVCTGNTMDGNLPAYDVSAAKKAIQQSGSPVSITLLYPSENAQADADAQYIAAQWKEIGVEVKPSQKPVSEMISSAFDATATWDALLLQVSGGTPPQMSPYVSGAVAPDGSNFAGIVNDKYDSLAKQANAKTAAQGCADWNAAEAALFKNADLFVLSQAPYQWWGKDVTYEVTGYGFILPTSIRMRSS